ncbi:LuxR C-terminal-related transcriptional regulator [Streptomyces sp. NPDC047070]|uniref:helix-turn-helix transcriptional regulator n=1 Tax=Streptomyces sp. NPDC047070 TaxID=3154923 RepID=UPI0034514D92
MSEDTVTEWPMAGRNTELDRIEAAVARGHGALLTGEPGVGKSRLLRASLRRAAEKGAEVRLVSGAGICGADVSSLFTGWASGQGGEHDAVARHLLDDAFPGRRTPAADGLQGRFVLGLDDAHCLAPAFAARLRAGVAEGRLTLVATVRAGVPAPDGVNRLWVERLVERMEIAELDRSAAADVVHAKLGGHVAAAALERLWSFTQGNALLLTELADSALADGSLRSEDGTWLWDGLNGRPAARLADLVHLRLGHLSPDERRLVQMIALAEPLEAELSAVAELTHAVETLDRRGLITAELSGLRLRLRLAYPLYRPVLVSSLPELTGLRLRRRLADALEDTGLRRDDDVLRMAVLRIDAGQLPCADQLQSAARTALRHLDFALTERLCLLALPLPDADIPTLMLLRGRALQGQGRHAEAETLFAGMSAERGPTNTAVWAEAVQARSENLAWGLRLVQDAEAVLDEAVTAAPETGRGLLQGTRTVMMLLGDRLEEAAAMGETVLAEPRDPAVVQRVLPPAAFARNELGDAVGALALLQRCRPEPGVWSDEARLSHQLVAACAALQTGAVAVAGAILDGLPADTEDDRPGALWTASVRARLYRSCGRYADGIGLLRQVSAPPDTRDWLTTKAWRLAQMAGALAEAGEHAEAMRVLVEVRSEESGTVRYPLAADGVAMERALVLAHVGDLTGALHDALELGERAAVAGRAFQALTALHLVARIGEARAVAERASALAQHLDSGLAALQAEHVRALADADGDALAALAERFEAMGLLPLAAEASAQACRAHRAAGRHRRSRATRTECQELLQRFGGTLPVWAALDKQGSEPSAELTGREREVAALAASGLSNQDVADRLGVSVRTVENHLHRAYGKLGVTTRADLAQRLDSRLSADGFGNLPAPAPGRTRRVQDAGPAQPRADRPGLVAAGRHSGRVGVGEA